MMRVYLSYTAKDSDFVNKLLEELRNRYIDVFAFNEPLVKPGDSWVTSIMDAISKSEAIIVILSPESIKSTWVSTEIALALSGHTKDKPKRIIPVIIKPVDNVPPLLNQFQWLDMSTDEKFNANIDRLVSALQSEGLDGGTRDAIKDNIDLLGIQRRLYDMEAEAYTKSRIRTLRGITIGVLSTYLIITIIATMAFSLPSGHPWAVPLISFFSGMIVTSLLYQTMQVLSFQTREGRRQQRGERNG